MAVENRTVCGRNEMAADRWVGQTDVMIEDADSDVAVDGITPDTKDWTWVLETACQECGFDASACDASSVGSLLRTNAAEFAAVLTRPADELGRRPDEGTWSPLEYAVHVRDVYRLFRERLAMMLDSDDPLFANWDQDETAVADRYREQDPAVVSEELLAAAEELATAFDAVCDPQWARTGRRSDGASFTVETFALYFIHDPIHHLHDVR